MVKIKIIIKKETGCNTFQILDHYTFLGNCPPTPLISQRFALSEK